jgi:carbon starvation protein CstA
VDEERVAAGPAGREHAGPGWLVADVVAVLVFAAVGRRSHDEAGSLAGVLATAWPFLAGSVVGWLVSRAWVRATRVLPTGVTVWLCTVVIGMLLRRLTGHGTAVSFVVVALVVLGAFLLGWRGLRQLAARRRAAGRDGTVRVRG